MGKERSGTSTRWMQVRGAGVARIPFRSVRCRRHAREIFGHFGVAEKVKQDGRRLILAVVAVCLDPGTMVTVRDRAFVLVEFEEQGALADGLIDFRTF